MYNKDTILKRLLSRNIQPTDWGRYYVYCYRISRNNFINYFTLCLHSECYSAIVNKWVICALALIACSGTVILGPNQYSICLWSLVFYQYLLKVLMGANDWMFKNTWSTGLKINNWVNHVFWCELVRKNITVFKWG